MCRSRSCSRRPKVFDPARFYSAPEVWRLSGAPRSFVYEALASGDLPAIRRGRRWLVPGMAVIRWLESAGASR